MNIISRKSRLLALRLASAVLLAPAVAHADDIDIFLGKSGGTAVTPNVIILLDNSPSWDAADQKWPDQPTQGQAEIAALQNVLKKLFDPTVNPNALPMNIGVALLQKGTLATGSYVRFGARDLTNSQNLAAVQDILGNIYANVHTSDKLTGTGNKDESAGLYELYKYFTAQTPYSGAPANGNPKADFSGNTVAYTASAEGLTSGFALATPTSNYSPPVSGCSKNYIIYIANNGNNSKGSLGQSSYESTSVTPLTVPPPSYPTMMTPSWTKFLSNNGITTYVMDAYNANLTPKPQYDPNYSGVLTYAASQGGTSKSLQVSSQADIEKAFLNILAEIQSVNSSFASASLPLSATNRTQQQNEVFIGMFRPDENPRWYGNLKRYQLILTSTGGVDLGDASNPSNPAINTQSGFLANCAMSFWTSDSAQFWQNVTGFSATTSNLCSSATKYSDSPDGPFVEKGGVAEVIRQGNNPPYNTTNVPTWHVNRSVLTQSGTVATPASLDPNNPPTGLTQSLVKYILGYDVDGEVLNPMLPVTTSSTADPLLVRAALHGDVIHSRPLPVTYPTGISVFYGANDGALRSIDAATGREQWAFVAPEFFNSAVYPTPPFQRLNDNSPKIAFPTQPTGYTPTPTPKDYFFDGSIGLYQNADSTSMWIYPSMRRGGRMLYGLDVSTFGAAPTIKWKVGCPNPVGNDTGCTTGMAKGGTTSTSIGQTWSQPSVALIKGFSTTTPVVVVGGGYDPCEDANTSTPSCSTTSGNVVYVINADTGAVIQQFSTQRSVAADVAMVDVNNDGFVDYAYVADTGGNIYRIDFVDGPLTVNPLASTAWGIRRVAYTNNAGRKFLFPPALLYNKGKVYVAIGSGDREHPLQTEYPFTPSPGVVNRFYVYADDPTVTASSTTPPTNLDDSTGAMLDVSSGASCSSPQILPSSTKQGWFMNLNQNATTTNPYGEQTVTSALIAGGMVTFSTNRPVPSTTGTCTTVLGEARGYWVNLLNGSGAVGVNGSCGGQRSALFVGGGLPPSPVLARVPVNGTTKTVVIGAVQKSGAVSSTISPQIVQPAISSKRRRVYWYQSGDTN